MTILNKERNQMVGVFGTGVAVYPRLNKPDTKFESLGVYKADLRVPFEEAKPLMDELSVEYKNWTGNDIDPKENTLWMMAKDKNTKEETGEVIFKFRIKNLKKDDEIMDRKPALFFKNEEDKGKIIGGGSLMKVEFQVYNWKANKKGVSLQPRSVLIETLVEPEKRNPFGEGFAEDAEENNNNNEESFSADTEKQEDKNFY